MCGSLIAADRDSVLTFGSRVRCGRDRLVVTPAASSRWRRNRRACGATVELGAQSDSECIADADADRQICAIAVLDLRLGQSRVAERAAGEHTARLAGAPRDDACARCSRTAGWIYRPKAYTLLFGEPPPKLL
jgi:hypothetical protein